MNNSSVGYVSLFLGIGAVLGGIHFGTGGMTMGWVAVAIGLALVGVAFLKMRRAASE